MYNSRRIQYSFTRKFTSIIRGKERERRGEIEREGERDRERQRSTERERQRETKIDRERETERETVVFRYNGGEIENIYVRIKIDREG